MTARIRLPRDLTRGPFTVARGAAAGLSPDRLRGRDLHRPFYGVRSADPVTTILDRCRAYEQRMPPHAFFCSVTAALLFGVPLPRRLEESTVVHVARARLRRMLQGLVTRSRKSDLYEVWVPVAQTNGFHIPASIVVGPLPQQPSGSVPVHDSLLSLSAASPASRAVTVGGALAVRIVADRAEQRDEANVLTAPAVRIVSFIVSPLAPAQPWITVTASLFVPDVEGALEIVEAMEFLVDALVATVQIDTVQIDTVHIGTVQSDTHGANA